MKKFSVFFVLSILVFSPLFCAAAFLSPYHYLNLIVKTTGGDSTFNINISTYNILFGSSDSLQIATRDGEGSYSGYNLLNKIYMGSGDSYFLSEDSQPGWQQSISCANSYYGQVGEQAEGGIILHNYLYTTDTCVILNVRQADKTPILIVPGVLGSSIIKGTDLLWANLKMARGFDGFMDPLAFKEDLSPLDYSLSSQDVIKKLTFNTGLVNFEVYDYTDGLINQFTSKEIGYTEGKDLFTFPYDWRFGVNSSTVDQLKGQIDYILTQTDAGKAAGKVDVVAHSTGGLLVKKYVMSHPADHHIGKAVFVGVPNLGAPKALKALLVGDNFDVPNLDESELKKITQNMPVVYDLAPSQEYFNQAGSFFRIHNLFAVNQNDVDKDLNYNEAIQRLIDNNYINSKAVSNSANLHTPDFENYDLRNEGVDLYSIVGCKGGTFGKVTESVNKYSADPSFDFPQVTNGDQTVPFISADSLQVDGSKTFFAPQIKHGDLLSADGSRQEIVNLLTGSNLNTNSKILTHDDVIQHPDKCEIKGEQIKIKSPVNIGVTDQNGNYSGLAADGSIQNDIPGADYEVWGEHKYVFLPKDNGQQYSVRLLGTGIGTFTLQDESINGSSTIQTQIFSNLPVTPALTGQVNLGSGGGQTTLSVQENSTSAPVTIFPSAIVNSDQSQDITAPISTSTITGLMGQEGYYRSNATVTISSIDPVVNNNPSQTSGLLKMQYSLDGGEYQVYSSTSPIAISSEGQHTIKFFSTDRAGNNEAEKSIFFVIDKTAPELGMQFNVGTQDLDFTATDTLPTVVSATSTPIKTHPPKVVDADNIITAIDAAGNTTVLTFKDKDRKHQFKADVKSLSYNGVSQDISKLQLHFDWLYDKKGKLQILTQNVQAKKEFNVSAVYALGKTIILGKDQNGKINKVISGIVPLKINTNLGNFVWAY